jgi:polar amino acid transport system permease protein
VSFDPAAFLGAWREIAAGLGTSVLAWVVGVALGMALGFAIAVAQLWLGRGLAALLRAYIEIVRGVPFLVQLFILYYGGPFVGVSLEPLPAGIVGLAIYGSAYFAEVFRAGFLAVPRGQLESAAVLGLTRLQAVRRIEVPQMLVIIVPSLVNLAIVLSKETAVMSIITVPELTLVVTAIGSRTYAYIESTLILALCYWGMVEAAAWGGRAAERRVGRYLARPA